MPPFVDIDSMFILLRSSAETAKQGVESKKKVMTCILAFDVVSLSLPCVLEPQRFKGLRTKEGKTRKVCPFPSHSSSQFLFPVFNLLTL